MALNFVTIYRRSPVESCHSLGHYGTQVARHPDRLGHEYLYPNWPQEMRNQYCFTTFDRGPLWYDSLDVDGADILLQSHLESIFNAMTGQANTGISPLDISAILHPTETYQGRHKYPMQFSFSILRQKSIKAGNPGLIKSLEQLRSVLTDLKAIQRETRTNASLIEKDTKDLFFFKNNYFGKYLGKHLEVIMEILYHGMLKPGVITLERYKSKPKIYRDAIQLLQLPIQTEKFHPTWNTYKFDWPAADVAPDQYYQEKSYPLYYDKSKLDLVPVYSYFINFPEWNMIEYRNSPLPEYKPYYTGPEEVEDTDGLRRLKLNYQHNQMMPLCIGPFHNDVDRCQDHFKPVPTDSGICYAFNANDIDSFMKSNDYLEMFKYVFDPQTDRNVQNNTKMACISCWIVNSATYWTPSEAPSRLASIRRTSPSM